MSDALSPEDREFAARAKFEKWADEWFEKKAKDVKTKKTDDDDTSSKPKAQSQPQSEPTRGQSLLQHLLNM